LRQVRPAAHPEVVKPGHLSAFAGLLVTTVALRGDDAADRHFVDRVKPLLDSRCVSCHRPDKVKGGLRLDSRAAVLQGGESGPAIVPGKPAESLLVQAVTHQRKAPEMPPKEKLTPADVTVLERWIRDGAPWPELAATVPPASRPGAAADQIGDAWNDPRNPIVRLFGGQRLDLWSLKPVKQVEVPALDRASLSIRNPIDRFVAAKLAENGLDASPEADRRTLIRRLTFDLTGLPPTPEEVADFVEDGSSDAYGRLVDRLLASPRYGEHQARLWLDVVRYSDSNGFDWDEFRQQAWRFRDYVVRAFNADKPYDQFLREQLAGDELLAGPPQNGEEQDALIATGYLCLGPRDNSAGAFNEQDRARAELLADLTETTGSAFLGLTLSCCRCHDHKYDPLSQADHFRLRAFFAPVKFADDLPLDLAADQSAIRQHNESIDARIKPLQQQRDELIAAVKQRLRTARVAQLSPEDQALLALPKDRPGDDAKVKVERVEKKVEPSDAEAKAALAGEEKERHTQLEQAIAHEKQQRRAFTSGLIMTDAEGTPPVTRVLFQGNHQQPRDPVEPGFLSALDPNAAAIERSRNSKTTGRRLTLAEWIASPANPLTARVLVNRVWQQHFGRGLVATPNDFGLAGARPTHPELLDWLAGEFVRNGWSVKQLHRLMVMSGTYRQASAIAQEGTRAREATTGTDPSAPASTHAGKDAENTLLWRQNPRRLSAEQLRDALLATAGSLQLRPGGPPVWPDLPPEILQANPAFLDDNATRTKGWYPSPKAEQNVRSVLLVQKRTVHVPFLDTFDLPENATSCARRNTSTVAPQALALLNSPLATEAAVEFARRVQQEAGDNLPAQVSRAFRIALQRPPAPEERELCLRLAEQRNLTELCRALLNLNEFLYID
jgi:hypothetical protein